MTKDNFEGWLTYQVTQEVKDLMKRRVREYEDLLVELAAGCCDTEKLSLQAARLAGMIAGVNAFIELTWEDIENA